LYYYFFVLSRTASVNPWSRSGSSHTPLTSHLKLCVVANCKDDTETFLLGKTILIFFKAMFHSGSHNIPLYPFTRLHIVPSGSELLLKSVPLRMLKTIRKDTELLGFWTFSIVWYSREHDVSETGSVSILR
jgi:hypothetical protein